MAVRVQLPPPVTSVQLEEVHHAVMDVLGTSQGKQLPSHERRLHPRVVFNEPVSIYLSSRPEPIVCYARDLSKGGISFIAQQKLPDEITISFKPSPESESRALLSHRPGAVR